jgi:hypothetical protein
MARISRPPLPEEWPINRLGSRRNCRSPADRTRTMRPQKPEE